MLGRFSQRLCSDPKDPEVKACQNAGQNPGYTQPHTSCQMTWLSVTCHAPGPPKVPKIMAQYPNIESIGSVGSIVLGTFGGPGKSPLLVESQAFEPEKVGCFASRSLHSFLPKGPKYPNVEDIWLLY